MIAPWREWNIRSREDALAYATTHGVPVDQTPRDMFSRDGNLWHLSHEGGNLEDPWDAPRKEMFKLTVDPEDAPDAAEVVTHRLRARACPWPWTASGWGRWTWWRRSNRIAGAHGVGRLDLVENRLVGIKSRGVYETPAGTVLYVAHRELERLVLDRNTLHFKQSVSVRYAQLIYDGLWFSTLRQALAAFVDFTEQEVTGEVRVRLFKGRAEAIGRRSPRSLYRQDLATFGAGMAYDHKDAEGFIRLFGLPERVRALTRERCGGRRGAGRSAVVEVEAMSGHHRAAGLPRRGGGRRDQAGRARPRAAGRRLGLLGGRRLHHQPRAGRARGRLARAPAPAARPGRSWSTRAAPTRPRASRACATRGRWRPWPRAELGCRARRGRGRLHGRHRRARCPWRRCGPGSRRGRRACSRDGGAEAARAILTTDTRPKEVAGRVPAGRPAPPAWAPWPRARA